jgi:hypothetical protein
MTKADKMKFRVCSRMEGDLEDRERRVTKEYLVSS